MLTTAASYRMISSDLARSIAIQARKPNVARETEYYLANIGKVKSIDEFLADHRLFSYAMKAFGLGDMAYAKGLMKRVLAEGIDERNSFANRLTDSRYRDFVETFNFARYGPATTSFERAQRGSVDRYLRQTLEEAAGAENEGVRLALYFERRAPDIRSTYGILADPALLKVVETALGLPAMMATGDIDRKADAISRRLDVSDFKDPRKLQRFLERFATMWDLSNQPAALPGSAAALVGRPPEAGIAPALLASLQKLKLGGP